MIIQSGNITPGHGVKWITDNVAGDAGPLPSAQRVLASLLEANFNSTEDQALELPAAITAFQLTGILVTNASLSLTTAAGGFYPEAAKAGSPIVDAAQIYSALTDADLLLQATLTAYAQTARFSRSNIPDWMVYLSLTTPQGAAAVADVYLLGIDLTL